MDRFHQIYCKMWMKKILNEGNQKRNFMLCLWELLWFHFIAVPVPLRSVIKLRFRFLYSKKYGSGSATLLLICQSLAVADTEPDALWKEHGGIGPWNVLYVYIFSGQYPPTGNMRAILPACMSASSSACPTVKGCRAELMVLHGMASLSLHRFANIFCYISNRGVEKTQHFVECKFLHFRPFLT